jgi:phytoene dehydrogenase-like protein
MRSTKTDFDAIVIGAGHNGLASALHLAAQGWKVGIFERNAVAGGAVQTREVTLPGFRHDLFAMNLSMFAGSGFNKAYGPLLARHGLAFAPAADSFASVFPDGRWFGVSTDLEMTARRAAAFAPQDGESWKAMAAAFGKTAPHIFGVLGNEIPSLATAKVLYKAWRAEGLPWLIDMFQLAASSPRGFLDRHFQSDQVKAALAAWGMHLDFPPDLAGGALFPYLEGMVNQAFGMVIGLGGADVVIKALTGALNELGAVLHLDAEVTGIDMQGGRASAITLADGRIFSAAKAIIANALPQHVFGRLLKGPTASTSFDERIAKFRPGPGTMMVHYALEALPGWRADEDLKRFAYVHLAPDMAMMSRAYTDAKAGLLPAEPVLVVGQPTAIDPGRAPDGKHILWVQVRVVPSTVEGDAAGLIAAGHWDGIKEMYADRVTAIIERHAPGFGATILKRAVFSPADLERENPNLLGGDQLGGSHHLDQFFLFRPIPGWSRYKTPVNGLYMVGASTWPGAGVGAGSGFLLGKKLIAMHGR